ncbi:T9SS type A sorting domain-containing protein [uncultured Polaribacter sp.]|uniref:T9SS type A sorting domain-containing protein n=1 Tax=uncultured Polaribacter sp. TaxID=174711 RepID=UPI00259B9387|nr:T9SS type A sorting domain-containing protein [uncultured Polaribacter sp.]
MRFLKYKILFGFVLLSTLFYGQQIKTGEYFFNNDPGYGNGTSFTVTETNGEFTKTIETPVQNLPSGFHTIYVRVKQNNVWSTFDRNLFYKIDPNIAFTGDVSIKNIKSAEYFIDADPGYGKGEAIAITETNELESTFSVDVSSLAKGMHIIYVRVKSVNNQWSNFSRRLFYISTKQEITYSESSIVRAEYFFDTDPGYGKGENIPLDASGKEISQAFTVDVSSLEEGFHIIYFRVQNGNKEWSTFERSMFYKSGAAFMQPEESPIIAAEYYFNEFKDYGKGTAITVATNSEGNFETDINTGNLTEGEHLLFVRAKNEAGIWGLHDVVAFKIDNALGVNQALVKDFGVYPNPVQDVISVTTSHQLESYKLFNSVGVEVKTGSFKENSIKVSNLSTGVYFCVIKSDKGTIVKRIVKK